MKKYAVQFEIALSTDKQAYLSNIFLDSKRVFHVNLIKNLT